MCYDGYELTSTNKVLKITKFDIDKAIDEETVENADAVNIFGIFYEAGIGRMCENGDFEYKRNNKL